MSRELRIIFDGAVRVVIDRTATLPGLERSRMEQLDEMLGQGIGEGRSRIENPGLQEKTRFVIGELMRALQTANDAATGKLTTYLAHLQPELCELEAVSRGDELDVHLHFNENSRPG